MSKKLENVEYLIKIEQKNKRQLEEKQFDYRFRTLGTYSYILLAACEDLPMCGMARAISAPFSYAFGRRSAQPAVSLQGHAELLLSDLGSQRLSSRQPFESAGRGDSE